MSSRAILRVAAIAILVTSVNFAGDARWVRMRSPNFEVYSAAGEGDARRVLSHFENLRSFFVQTVGQGSVGTEPVTVVVFGSRKQFQPYRIIESAVAYHHQSVGRDFIVLGEPGDAALPMAGHEYTHVVARRRGLSLPAWLNEGMAELFSTVDLSDGKAVVGGFIPRRRRALLVQRWIPLQEIVAANSDSNLCTGEETASAFYNESWALVHMLAMSPEYRSGFRQLLGSIAGGASSPDAILRAYGRSVDDLEADLRDYLAEGSFQGATFDVRLDSQPELMGAEEAPSFDMSILLATLRNRPGKPDESRRAFQVLAEEAPNRPEPLTELGYLAWTEGNLDEARSYYRNAFELGERGSRMLWDYARLSRNNPAEASRILQALLQQEPDRVDVRLELAQIQLALKEPAAALETVAQISDDVAGVDLAKLYKVFAYAYAHRGDCERAREAATRWRKEAGGAADAEAARLLAYLDSAALLRRTEAGAEPARPMHADVR